MKPYTVGIVREEVGRKGAYVEWIFVEASDPNHLPLSIYNNPLCVFVIEGVITLVASTQFSKP